MTTVSEFLQEQKRVAEESANLKVDTTFGRVELTASKRTIVALDRLVGSVPVMIAALEGVLALHRPVEIEPSETVCHGCSTLRGAGRSARYFPYTEYPCPNVRAIEAALGGEGDE